jgi:hypothetical protein
VQPARNHHRSAVCASNLRRKHLSKQSNEGIEVLLCMSFKISDAANVVQRLEHHFLDVSINDIWHAFWASFALVRQFATT